MSSCKVSVILVRC